MGQSNETPLAAFFQWERTTPEQVFLRQPIADIWKTWTYQQAGDEARRIASALMSLNLPPGSNIAILSKNCAHWIMADLAIMMAGYVSVPIYPTLSASSIRQLLEHSQSRLIFLGKLDDYERQRSGIDEELQKISFPLYGPGEGLKWEELLNTHDPHLERTPPDPERLASIMYSSGTTGTPKGVMLSFGNFGYVGVQVKKGLRLDKPQRFFSYLPLSHIAERALMEMVALSSGSTISFSESIEKFQQNLQHEKPTVFGGVPRIFSKFQEGILNKIPQSRLDRLLSVPLLNAIVGKVIIKRLGLAHARVVVCGAAPIPVSLLKWFNRLGLQIRETYGMTENTAYSHSNFRLIRNGTVGQPWPEVEVRFSDEGEILVRHPALMQGYYKDEKITSAVFTEEGFLKTGDQGQADAQGFLTITGRLKDQFKTEKAKFIAPAPMELSLSSNPDIDQVCVVGSGLPQPIALMTLSLAASGKTSQQVDAGILASLDGLNKTLEPYERIQTAVILNEPWTIESGLITPSLKVKRGELEKRYQPHFTRWTSQGKKVVRDAPSAGANNDSARNTSDERHAETKTL